MLTLIFGAAAFLRFYRLDALPLGFHHDEGLDAVAALEVWTKGQHPIFFPQQGSREPLMIYLESLGILALGATRLGARIAQACVGTAGVVAAWFLFRRMFSRRLAFLATAVMAVSFWQMFESRLGLRAISQPLFETVCLLFFWRTLTHRRWSDALLAGVFLGITMYTYTAARALPLLLVVVALWQLAFAPAFLAKQWGRMLLTAGIGAAVFAPLGVYAFTHTEEFFGRSLQVSVLSSQPYTGSGGAGDVWSAVLHTLGMFSVQGDPEWKYNIGGLPVFDWPLSALFYGGLVVAVVAVIRYLRWPRSDRPVASPHAFLLLWLPVMLLPGFLSAEAPHFLRTIGIIPAVYAVPAMALDWLIARWRWFPPVAAVFLLGEGVETGYRYFQEWAHAPDAYYGMHADAADVAAYLRQASPSEPVLFSSEYPGHPTLLYLAPQQFSGIRWFNGRESMAFPPPGQQALYVFTARYQPAFLDLSRLFSPDQLVQQGHDPAGGVAYQVYRGSPVMPAPPVRVQADIGGLARLDGAALPASVKAGDTLDLQEYWHALQPGQPDIRAFVHLVDSQGNLWAQADSLGYYAEDWQPGDGAINDQRLEVPSYAPPLPMRLLFGLYSATSGQQLPVRDANGRPAGSEVELGTVQVTAAGAPTPGWRPPHAVDRAVAPGLALAGYDLPQTTVRAGATLPVDLYWRVSGPITTAPSFEVTLAGGTQAQTASSAVAASPRAANAPGGSPEQGTSSAGGSATAARPASSQAGNASGASSVQGTFGGGDSTTAATANGQGQVGAAEGGWRESALLDVLPAGQWPVGVIEDRRRLSVPPGMRAGIASISLAGLKLGEVAVTEPPRDYSLPPIEHGLGLPVGDFATLAGYTLEPLQAGQPLRLTLVWHDRAPTDISYKVFVHVLDSANQVIAQRDDVPQGGAMPTTFWLPGQVVSDHYEVPLSGPPPAGAQLEIGLYEPVSGKRLAIGPEDHVLLPLSR